MVPALGFSPSVNYGTTVSSDDYVLVGDYLRALALGNSVN